MQQKRKPFAGFRFLFWRKSASCRQKCAHGHARIPLPGGGRLMCARRRVGNNSAGDRWSPLLCVIRKNLNCFLLCTIFPREARPVIAAKANMPFLIERNSSVQSGGFLRAQALKFPFFLVSFSFGNERKRNSARSAETVCKDTKVRLPYIRRAFRERKA